MNTSKSAVAKAVTEDGYFVVENVLNSNNIELLVQEVARANNSTFAKQRDRSTYAIRNALLIPEIHTLAYSQPVISLADTVLNAPARPVKAILFDKTPQANWRVGWHQDLTIAVNKYQSAIGFSGWSKKAGIIHVQPPVEILENLLTLRIHLDDCNSDNGVLNVIPSSHRYGKIALTDIESIKKSSQVHICEVQAGGILIMRPLLLHSSSPSINPSHRRVLHIKYSATNLPHGLEWCDRLN